MTMMRTRMRTRIRWLLWLLPPAITVTFGSNPSSGFRVPDAYRDRPNEDGPAAAQPPNGMLSADDDDDDDDAS
jgi:hypothetical protein